MDAIMEKDKSLAREIVRRLLDAWRLKRAYKYRSEKRITHRKLYFSLMRQLMHEIGQRNLHDIIMQRIAFFNHNFMTSLAIDQFHDLMSDCNKPQELGSSEKVIEAGKSEMQQSTKQDVISDNTLINADKSNDSGSESGYEIKSTDALRNLSLYQYDPEHDNEEILSSIKEIEREEEDEDGNEKTEDANAQAFGDLIDMKTKIEHELESQDEIKAIPKEGESNKKTNVKELLPDNEELRMKLEPMLVYRDDPDIYERVIALDIRGKKFKVSNDGKCPRCHHYRNVFVILDL